MTNADETDLMMMMATTNNATLDSLEANIESSSSLSNAASSGGRFSLRFSERELKEFVYFNIHFNFVFFNLLDF